MSHQYWAQRTLDPPALASGSWDYRYTPPYPANRLFDFLNFMTFSDYENNVYKKT
jgi:hypothetical protein